MCGYDVSSDIKKRLFSIVFLIDCVKWILLCKIKENQHSIRFNFMWLACVYLLCC